MAESVSGFVPEWVGPFQNYARSFVAKNAWRVSWRYDWEASEAIAAEVFSRIRLRYKFKNAQHAMGMFKLCLSREFHTLAREVRDYVEAERSYASEVKSSEITFGDGPLAVLIGEASRELQDVLSAIAAAPTDLLEAMLTEAEDAAWSRRLCRLSRIGVAESIVSELRVMLEG